MTTIARRTTGPVRPPTALWWLLTGLFALVLLVAAVSTAAAVYEVPLLVAFLACTAQSAALLLALTHPRTATIVQFAAVAVLALSAELAPGQLWPLPLPGLLVLVAHVAVVGLRHDWAVAVSVWWTSGALCVALVALDPLGRDGDATAPTLIGYSASSALVLVLALGWRHGGRVREELVEARRDAELEQSRRALVEERTRIARELHDVVAHGMSVIHMQAASAQYRHVGMAPEVRDELAQIATAARGAMREMRQILTVLREDGSDVERDPTPDLTQLPALVEGAAGAGLQVVLHLDPALPDLDLPQTVSVALYRTTQEALSNVVRHAPDAHVTVDVRWDEAAGLVTLTVVNTRSRAGGRDLDSSQDHQDAARRPHLGLVGIQERAELLGGDSQHGATAAGGFRVAVHLPTAAGAPGPALTA